MDEFIEFIKQWDIRYSDAGSEKLVKELLDDSAIIVKHETFKMTTNVNLRGIKKPQKSLKAYTISLFEKKKVQFIGFEQAVGSGVVDVMGRRSNVNVLVECGPCRVDKVYKYLLEDNNELWLVNEEFSLGSVTTVHLHAISRGPQWNSFAKRLQEWKETALKRVRSPLERIPD